MSSEFSCVAKLLKLEQTHTKLRTLNPAEVLHAFSLFINLDLHSKVFDSDIIINTMHSTQYTLLVGSFSHLEEKCPALVNNKNKWM